MQFLHIVSVCLVGLRLANGALDCAGKADGNYVDPLSGCSQIWYKCAAGSSSIQFCPDGLAYVDRNGGSCVDPNTLAACANPVGGAEFTCAPNGDGDFPNNASMCSQVSGYACKAGIKSVRFCWATSRFDPLSQRCLFPKHMKMCGGLELILSSDLLPPTPAPKEIQFDCLKKVGNFPDPEKPCSNNYVICRPDGFPSTGVCPANTVFDIDNNWCQYPQFVLACGGHPTTVPPMTTSGPSTSGPTTMPLPGAGTTTMMDTTLSCDGLDIGYYAHPKQPCSSTYFACTGLKWAIPEPCAAGTFFDRVLVLCTYRDQIPECGGVRPNNTAIVPGQVAPDTRFNCSGLKPGNYQDMDKECSRFFYSCTTAGLAFKQLCQINTFYDKDLDQCLFYADVPACSGTPRPPTTTATTLLPGGTATTPKPFDCTGKEDRNYAAVEPCSEFFWECAYGNTYKQPCPAGLKYDVYSDACQRETDVIGCPKYIPRSTFCASKPIDGAYAYPGQCGTFVMCVKGMESVLTCPSGGVFDARTNQCKQIKDVPAPCGTGPNPSPLSCVNQTLGAHWNEKDCGVYITCTDNMAVLSRCDEGRAFNPTTSTCVPMNQVPQCFPAAQDGLNKFCQDIPDGAYAFPGNCRRALFCVAKKAYVFYCWDSALPAWNSVAHKCVAASSTCTANLGL